MKLLLLFLHNSNEYQVNKDDTENDIVTHFRLSNNKCRQTTPIARSTVKEETNKLECVFLIVFKKSSCGK
jgi:hypothetical protein